ncbi:MAG: hypothetical protein HY223_03165 [Thaumarchaeota archaeon]|nr:hypothetical protein [Nitrososphaerota archaeon]
MSPITEYVPAISAIIFAGMFSASLLQFSAFRKNMRIQTEQQIYARIMDVRLKLENTSSFTKMAAQSPDFAERFSLVDSPEEYYTVVAFFDLFEYMFRLTKTKMIDQILWLRWKSLAQLLMTIPKFQKVWLKTRQSHTKEFIEFIDSLT